MNATAPTSLVAHTEAGGAFDALPVAGSDAVVFASPRRTLWGLGEAVRIHLPSPWHEHTDRVAEVLGAITRSGPDGPGRTPVAFGALPYEREAPATLVVPAVLHARTSDGDRWTIRISGPGVPEAFPPEPVPSSPSSVVVRAAVATEWMDAVEQATARIDRGDLVKVVLAREIAVTADVAFDAVGLAHRMHSESPSGYTYVVDGFVGVTPELLVSRIGDVVRAHPMAGTAPRTGDPEADARRTGELLASGKNRVEHRITIDMVHDTLLPWCSYLDAEPTPSVVTAGPVQHLATLVEGRLSHPEPSVLQLVAALHPTPAVGGWPRAAALELQSELEHCDRGRYAGPVGWVDASGNGVFGVGIRGAQLDGPTARVFTGVGVVAGSDPSAELEETRAKARMVLGALTRV